jgi:hypothetical protein
MMAPSGGGAERHTGTGQHRTATTDCAGPTRFLRIEDRNLNEVTRDKHVTAGETRGVAAPGQKAHAAGGRRGPRRRQVR